MNDTKPSIGEAARAAQAPRVDSAGIVIRTACTLPEEVPVAIVCNGTTQAVMMASPADLADFAHGFALTEGFITGEADVDSFEVVSHADGLEARFWLVASRAEALATRRRSLAGPVGCGLCGIDSLAQAVRPLPRLDAGTFTLSPEETAGATDALRTRQPLHDLTGAVHAAGFLRPGLGIGPVREDVGRHNALDKLVGTLMQSGIPRESGAVVMTSRVSIELVQKCAQAGIPALIAVSAPTAAACDAARQAGLSLAARARNGHFEVHAAPHRFGLTSDGAGEDAATNP